MHKWKRTFLIIFSIIFVSYSVLSNIEDASGESMKQVEDNLEGITAKEKAVLEDLFFLTQEIEAMEREETETTKEIHKLQNEMKTLELNIYKQEEDYNSKLSIMKEVLVNYEKMGPVSYLNTLLSANDLTTFLRSINIIRNLTANVGELLDSIEEGKRKLSEEKAVLADNVIKLEAKEEELNNALLKKKKLKEEQENYLNSLKEDKVYYEEQLGNLEQNWEESKVLYSKIMEEFKTIISQGCFETKDLNLNMSFTKISGSIYEDTFNQKLKDNTILSKMVFDFKDDMVELSIPEKHLILKGIFVIEKDSIIKYQVVTGSFYDMPLEKESIEELFHNGPLQIDFLEAAGDMMLFDFKLQSVNVEDGYLEFELKPVF